MNVIIDNYLWFIIGGVALLIIFIGYYAEKTNFGRKKFDAKDVKEEEIDIIESEPILPLNQIIPKQPINTVLQTTNVSSAIPPLQQDTKEIENLEMLNFSEVSNEPLNVNDGNLPQSLPISLPNSITDSSQDVVPVEKVESQSTNFSNDDIWKF